MNYLQKVVWVWWCALVIPALRRLAFQVPEIKVGLCYRVKWSQTELLSEGGAAEMARSLGAPSTLAEVWGSVPSTHVVHNNLYLQFQGIWHHLLTSRAPNTHMYIYTWRQNTHGHKIYYFLNGRNLKANKIFNSVNWKPAKSLCKLSLDNTFVQYLLK